VEEPCQACRADRWERWLQQAAWHTAVGSLIGLAMLALASLLFATCVVAVAEIPDGCLERLPFELGSGASMLLGLGGAAAAVLLVPASLALALTARIVRARARRPALTRAYRDAPACPRHPAPPLG
jgi:hypothetical protein